MPLDEHKITHIHNQRARTMQGRQHTVVLVRQISGVYSYHLADVILRPRLSTDPQYPASTGIASRPQWDTAMIAPLEINLNNVVCIADTDSATSEAVAGAPKYEILEALPMGIVPGGTRIVAKLRYLR